jgi:hypothetical protein
MGALCVATSTILFRILIVINFSKNIMCDIFGDDVAPDGNLVVDNFNKWFAASKAVDSLKRPLILFHGTVIDGESNSQSDELPLNAFKTFDLKKCGSITDTTDGKAGFWFSKSERRAYDAAVEASEILPDKSRYVYAVYLCIENPMILKNIKDYSCEEVGKLAKKAKKMGHDGLIFSFGEYGESDYLVFKPSQIKSANANSGLFKTEDQDISDNAEFHKDNRIYPQRVLNFEHVTKIDFLGKPIITKNANASYLKPMLLKSMEKRIKEPFMQGKYEAVYTKNGIAVLDENVVVGSYHFGDTLVVDKKYRRQGIAFEMVYQFRTRFPNIKPSKSRTKASQSLQIKVWEKISSEITIIKRAKESMKAINTLSQEAKISHKII